MEVCLKNFLVAIVGPAVLYTAFAANAVAQSSMRESTTAWGKTGDRRDVSGFVRLSYFLLVARFARVIAQDTLLRLGWSSAAVHRGTAPPDISLGTRLWEQSWTTGDWRNYLAVGTSPAEAEAIRESTHTGGPLGTGEFMQRLERDSGRALVAQKGGHPRQAASDSRQSTLNF
jgi:hypothetical protein